MVEKRPLIGVSEPDNGGNISWFFLRLALFMAGAKAVRLSAGKAFDYRLCQGFILSGGKDIHPSHYQGIPKPRYGYDEARDRLELTLLRFAEEHQLPVLGICRGAQLMNIHRGGSLHLDIRKVYEESFYPSSTLAQVFYRKRVHILPHTLLSYCLNLHRCRINSIHSQGVHMLGRGLIINAQERNGSIQGIEDPALPFYLGVQFHPEYLIYAPPFRALFRAFVHQCGHLAFARS